MSERIPEIQFEIARTALEARIRAEMCSAVLLRLREGWTLPSIAARVRMETRRLNSILIGKTPLTIDIISDVLLATSFELSWRIVPYTQEASEASKDLAHSEGAPSSQNPGAA